MTKSRGTPQAPEASEALRPIHPNGAAVDVHDGSHFVAVPPGRDSEGKDIREFTAFTADLHRIVAWLRSCRVQRVVMESTGVYWIPLFELLEQEGFEVALVDPRQARNLPGRKTDVADARWYQELDKYGLLKAAFRPEEQICVLRSYMRQRAMLISSAAEHAQHMQKALTQMNIKLTQVVSDILGVTGMRIIRAILAGERDPQKLAQLRDERCHSSRQEIALALEGNYRKEHLFALRQAVELYDFYQLKLRECDAQIEAQLKVFDDQSNGQTLPPRPSNKKPGGNSPEFDLRGCLFAMTGVDLTSIAGVDALTAAKVVAETGTDMSRFPSEKHFCAWLGVSPGSHISAGKSYSGRTRPCQNKAATALRIAAQTLYNSKTALGAFLRRMKQRLGPSAAITATAHKLARIIYAMLKHKLPSYQDLGAEYYEKKYKSRVLNNLKRRAKEFGFSLVPSAENATVLLAGGGI
jgi:transposase